MFSINFFKSKSARQSSSDIKILNVKRRNIGGKINILQVSHKGPKTKMQIIMPKEESLLQIY